MKSTELSKSLTANEPILRGQAEGSDGISDDGILILAVSGESAKHSRVPICLQEESVAAQEARNEWDAVLG